MGFTDQPVSGRSRRPGYTPHLKRSPRQMGEKNMEKLEELIRILSAPAMRARHSKAMSTRTCKICDGPALCFRDAVSSFEYRVSAICQDCQDKYLYAEDRRAS